MKILHVINSLAMGGAEKLLADTIPHYIKRGLEVDLLLLNGERYPFTDKLKRFSVKIHHLGMKSVYNPLHIFKIRFFLQNYDVIHVHLFPSLYWVALASILNSSRPHLIFTEHSVHNRRRQAKYRLLEKFIYARYKKIVSISTEADRLLKEHLKCHPDKTVLIPNGVNIKEITEVPAAGRDQFLKSNNERIIIQVSSFRPPKDQKTLIRALRFTKTSIRLLLVGKGEMEMECRALANELGLMDKIEFLGTRTDVYPLLKMADAAVLSSHYEGFSLSCLEAFASSTPLLFSDAPGLSDVTEGAGISFPVGDEKTLASHLDRLFEDHEYYRQVSNLGKERAKQFDIRHTIERHIRLYTDLAAG